MSEVLFETQKFDFLNALACARGAYQSKAGVVKRPKRALEKRTNGWKAVGEKETRFDFSRPPAAFSLLRKKKNSHLEVEGLRASAGQVRAQHPVHDRDDDTAVAVRGQEVQRDEVVDERSPVSVGKVDGRRDHGLAVRLGHLCDEAEIEQAELARVRARRDLQEVTCRGRWRWRKRRREEGEREGERWGSERRVEVEKKIEHEKKNFSASQKNTLAQRSLLYKKHAAQQRRIRTRMRVAMEKADLLVRGIKS